VAFQKVHGLHMRHIATWRNKFALTQGPAAVREGPGLRGGQEHASLCMSTLNRTYVDQFCSAASKDRVVGCKDLACHSTAQPFQSLPLHSECNTMRPPTPCAQANNGTAEHLSVDQRFSSNPDGKDLGTVTSRHPGTSHETLLRMHRLQCAASGTARSDSSHLISI
jgi:hypothetical protein